MVFYRSAAIAAGMISAACAQPALAAGQKVLYSFMAGTDGGFPQGGVIADPAGNLYGTTTSDGSGHSGVVYELRLTRHGHYRQETLYAFTGGNDGADPQSGLVEDAQGNFYGTTYAGGANGEGVVFELSPKGNGKRYEEKTLWTFTGGNDGGAPSCALILDKNGNLYGTTEQGGAGVVGTVFELSPPASGKKKWTETVLYNFTGNNDGGEPYGRMLLGSDGNLYGTTAGYGQDNYGTIFKLTAPSGSGTWSFSVLHAFAGGSDGEVPRDGLIQGPDGTLYGATAGFDDSYGNVFSLQPDGSAYTVLWTVTGGQGFTGNGPWQTVSLDASGNLYGATLADGMSSNGEVFELSPPKSGSGAWQAKVLYTFPGGAGGQYAYTTVLVGADGLYGTTQGVAGQSGFYPGTVWRLKK